MNNGNGVWYKRFAPLATIAIACTVVGGVVVHELQFRIEVPKHINWATPILLQAEHDHIINEQYKKDNDRIINLLTQNICLLIKTEAKGQLVFYPGECDKFISDHPPAK